jgi:chromosome segregation ATPase
MKNTLTTSAVSLATGLLTLAAATGFALPAFAATTNSQQSVTTLQTKSDTEITKDTNALTKFETRVEAMKKLSSTEMSTLTSQLQAQISSLSSIKAKIDADTTVAQVKIDIASLKAARLSFALVVPQDRLLTSGDKISTITAQMTTVETKLQARIAKAQTAGKSVVTEQTALSDMQAKIADANTQYTAAQSEAAGITTDTSDAATIKANRATLKDAQAKIKVADQDLKAARADITTIRTDLK